MNQSDLSLSDTTDNLIEKDDKKYDKNMTYVYKSIEERVADNEDCKHDLDRFRQKICQSIIIDQRHL